MLPTLQNKLALSSGEESLAQSGREDPVGLAPVLQLAGVSTRSDAELVELARNRRDILAGLAPMFKLAGIQVVIPRKVINDVPDGPYEEPKRSMKSLIRELQARDQWVEKIHARESAPSRRLRKRFQEWAIDDEGLVRRNGCLYVPGDAAVREELIRKHHDDPLSGHFGAQKTLDLIQRKYFWPACAEQVKAYVQTCNVCQRIKVLRHKSYEELSSLPVSEVPWKEISMDFITGLPPSKRGGVVYDAILVVVDRCTKMAKYLPVTTKIDAAELAELFFEEIVLRFGMPAGIVSDRGSLFTSAFWSALCYHAKIKRRLSTVFHF